MRTRVATRCLRQTDLARWSGVLQSFVQAIVREDAAVRFSSSWNGVMGWGSMMPANSCMTFWIAVTRLAGRPEEVTNEWRPQQAGHG